jgi:phosphoadenosine phosphosulfate reductase
MSAVDVAAARAALAGATAERVLLWVQERFGETAAIAASFGVEDAVLIDLAARVAKSVRIFTLDTGRLAPETYETMEAIRLRYGVAIETFFPEHGEVERLARDKGFFSFRGSVADRQECCRIRKVEPLARALAGRSAWITGRRRQQAENRSDIEVIEFDAVHDIVKLNPLAAWSSDDVWSYVRAHEVPYNVLHDRGYPSIGCAPCTRPVAPGEDPRAGRWWWESSAHKECGLHVGRHG